MPSYTAISLGTLSGGWRIIKTMGSKITKLQPVGGFAAETGAAVAICTATALGVGISTTHTITGAIVGVGATRRLSAVRWGVARPDRLGLGPDDSRVGDHWRAVVRARPALQIAGFVPSTINVCGTSKSDSSSIARQASKRSRRVVSRLGTQTWG